MIGDVCQIENLATGDESPHHPIVIRTTDPAEIWVTRGADPNEHPGRLQVPRGFHKQQERILVELLQAQEALFCIHLVVRSVTEQNERFFWEERRIGHGLKFLERVN